MKFKRKISLLLASIILILQFSDWVPIIYAEEDLWSNLFDDGGLLIGDTIAPDSLFSGSDSRPLTTNRPASIGDFKYKAGLNSFSITSNAVNGEDFALSGTEILQAGFDDKIKNLDGLEQSSNELEVLNAIVQLLVSSGTTVSNEFCKFQSTNVDANLKKTAASIMKDLVQMRSKAKGEIKLSNDVDGDGADDDDNLEKLFKNTTASNANYVDSHTYFEIQKFSSVLMDTSNGTNIFAWQFYDFTDLYYYMYILHVNVDGGVTSDDCLYIAQIKSRQPMVIDNTNLHDKAFTTTDTNEIMTNAVTKIAKSFSESIMNGETLNTKEVDRFNTFLNSTFKFWV